ncbi:MAG: response regulator transcription factor [Egibacteraceae bacterium]
MSRKFCQLNQLERGSETMEDPRRTGSGAVSKEGIAARIESSTRNLLHWALIDQQRCGRNVDDAIGSTVLLDIKVDGVRYILQRVESSPVLHCAYLLSPREAEIAQMVAEGRPNKTIASELNISSWTVSSHLRRIFDKLGVNSRAAMVARLLDDRSVPPDPSARNRRR